MIKEENMQIKNDLTEIKEEKPYIEQPNFDFEMEDHFLHQDLNLYDNIYSPISTNESADVVSIESPIVTDLHNDIDNTFNQCFNDIHEIMDYLLQKN